MKSKVKLPSLLLLLLLFLSFTTFSAELLVVLPGTIQEALGGSGWDPAGEITKMTHVGNDTYEFKANFPSGNYEYKVAVGGTWDENYGKNGEVGGDNVTLAVPEDNYEVSFTFDYNTKIVSDSINGAAVGEVAEVVEVEVIEVEKEEVAPGIGELYVTMPGSIQTALGGDDDWDTGGEETLMTHIGNDVYELVVNLPKGTYEYKVAIDDSWDENYGQEGKQDGSNISLTVPEDDAEVRFVFDYNTKMVTHELNLDGFFFVPVLTNTLERKGHDSDINSTNEFEFDIVSKNLNVDSKFSFNFDIDHEDGSVLESSVEKSGLSVKDFEIEDFALEYSPGDITYGVMVNATDIDSSSDPMKIFDTNQASDDRDNTIHPDEIIDDDGSNNIGVKIETEKFAHINIAVSQYKEDIFEDADTKKTLGVVDIKKDLLDDRLTLGTSNVYYQVEHNGENEDTVYNSTVFTEIDVTERLTIQGEVGYIPTGSIIESMGSSGSFPYSGNVWKFVFDPADYGITENIEEVHLVGEFKGTPNYNSIDNWTPSNKSLALTKDGDIWVGYFDMTNVDPTGDDDDAVEYKFMFNASSWNGNEKGLPSAPGNNATLVDVSQTEYAADGLEYGMNLKFAQLDYNLWDKGNFKVGNKSLAKDAYIRFSNDDLMDNSDTGYVETFANAHYTFDDRFKVYVDRKYKTEEEDTSNMINDQYKVGFELWKIPYLAHIKGSYEQDEYDTDHWDDGINELFLEVKADELPLVKFVTLNTSQMRKSEAQRYYIETEAKKYAKFIEHIKANATLVRDEEHYGHRDNDQALQYWTEIQFHNIPRAKFVNYAKFSYEVDDNGENGILEEDAYYDNDDDDWIKKARFETKLKPVNADRWDGIKIEYEARDIEDERIDFIPEDIDEDQSYYVSDKKVFVDWYTYLTLSSEYRLPYDVKSRVIFKYDFNHEEIHEYEDDALKFEFEKDFGVTTVNASYTKQDSDEGDDYTKLSFKSVW